VSDSATLELAGQTALVTGSSRGIGRAIALELTGAGADVVVHARADRREADEVARHIGLLGREATVQLADLAEPDAVDRLAEAAWAWRGRLDVLVCNAGADVLAGPAAQDSFDEKLQRLWQVDVLGTIGLARRIGEQMRRAGGGSILTVGWDGAARGMAGDTAQLFATAKGAVMAFSLSLAQSLAPEVRVNCLAPGWIRTGWAERASEPWQERARRESLLGRWGTPEDVARAARFLVGPAGGFISGQVLAVNGGFRPSCE